jgi:hypothetical protein
MLRKLASYDWQAVASNSQNTVTLHADETVTSATGSVPVFVAEAVRFMYRTSTKVLRTDEYEVSWNVTYPAVRQGERGPSRR